MTSPPTPLAPLPPTPWVIAITDPERPDWLSRAQEALLTGRAGWLHLRAKALSHAQRLQSARLLTATCRQLSAPLIVNGDVDIALAVGAQVLHAPSTMSLRGAERASLRQHGVRLSRACHSLEDVLRAQDEGFDMATLSPVFRPGSKPNDTRPTLGLSGLAQVCAATQLPIVALGGIEAERALRCFEAGAAGVAAIGWFHQ